MAEDHINHSDLENKVEQWTVSKLMDMVRQKKVKKPRFQRKTSWGVFKGANDKKPNFYEYISEHLFFTKTSVETITFARHTEVGGETYTNMDGGNRVNAIAYFYNTPLKLFHHNFLQLRANPQYTEFMDFITNISLPDLMEDARQIHKFIEKNAPAGVKQLWRDLKTESKKYVEDEMDRVVEFLRHPSGDRNFHQRVLLNINIFTNPRDEDMAKVFLNINSKSSNMSSNDIYAAVLLDSTNFSLSFDPVLEQQLHEHLEWYYDDKGNGDVHDCYTPDATVSNQRMNGHEFLIAFQCFLVTKFKSVIPPYDQDKAILHQLFNSKQLFFELKSECFTTANVQQFVHEILPAASTLNDIFQMLCDPAFDKCTEFNMLTIKTFNFIELNFMMAITIKLLRLVANHTIRMEEAVMKLRRMLVYHILVNDVPNDWPDIDLLLRLRHDDDLLREKGNARSAARTLSSMQSVLNTPLDLAKHVDEEHLQQLFAITLTVNNHDKDKNPKKLHKMTLAMNMLASVHFHMQAPSEYRDVPRQVDRIFSRHAHWANSIMDIERLGNLILIPKHIAERRIIKTTYKVGPIGLMYDHAPAFMKSMCVPSVVDYNACAKHDRVNNSCLVVVDLYNDMAKRREQAMFQALKQFCGF